MKKVIGSMLIVGVIMISSCEKNEDPVSIEGKWEDARLRYSYSDSTTTPVTVTNVDTVFNHGKSIITEFTSNGTFDGFFTSTDYSVKPSVTYQRGKYQLFKNNTIALQVTYNLSSDPSLMLAGIYNTRDTLTYTLGDATLNFYDVDSQEGVSSSRTNRILNRQ